MAKKTTSPHRKKRRTPPETAPSWKKKFLESLEEFGNVTEAAKAAGIDRGTAYTHRASDEDFAEKWEDALDGAADAIEAEIKRRAFSGSDTLLIFYAKALRPEKFREKFSIAPYAAQYDRTLAAPTSTDRGSSGTPQT